MNLVKSELYQLTKQAHSLVKFSFNYATRHHVILVAENPKMKGFLIHTSTRKRQIRKDFMQLVSLQLSLQDQGPGKILRKTRHQHYGVLQESRPLPPTAESTTILKL